MGVKIIPKMPTLKENVGLKKKCVNFANTSKADVGNALFFASPLTTTVIPTVMEN